MPSRTGIEWTDSTWNPLTGCTQVSAGCDNCYALTLARRLLSARYVSRVPERDSHAAREDPFAVRLWPERLDDPRKWRAPRRVFVNSMSDLFHSHVPTSFIRQVFEVMRDVDRHVYQVLTKRPSRLARFLNTNADLFSHGVVPSHIWLGTSVENQAVAHRVGQLRHVPAQIRFLSCEPLLGPLELNLEGIDWVIVGGESGPVRRQLCLDWVRAIRDQCEASDTPFFFKQIGGRTPKAGGRELDGRTWDAMPTMTGRSADAR
jgi:protein gp37